MGDSPDPPPLATAPLAPPPTAPPRYVPNLNWSQLPDGRFLSVASDLRVVVSEGQAAPIDTKGVPELGSPFPIPEALGGGWVFRTNTSVYFSATLDSPLLAVVHGSSWVDVGVGRSMLWVVSDAGSTVIHLPSGAPTAAPIPHMTKLIGLPSGLVAALDDQQLLYLSTKEGQPFQRVAFPPSHEPMVYGGELYVSNGTRTVRVAPDGQLVDTPVPDAYDARTPDVFTFAPPEGPFPTPELVTQWLSGYGTVKFDASHALQVLDAGLWVLDINTLRPAHVHRGAFDGSTNCGALRGGAPTLIYCDNNVLFRLDRIDTPPARETSPGKARRFMPSSHQTPLAALGSCGGDSATTLCLRTGANRWTAQPLADPEQLLTAYRGRFASAVDSDGRFYALAFDERNDAILLDTRQRRVRRIGHAGFPLWMPAMDLELRSVTVSDGTLSFLVAGSQPGLVRIDPDDYVTGTQLRGELLVSDSRALLITPDRRLRETVDNGTSFADVALPPGGFPSRPIIGFCSEVACALSDWTRIGWSR